MAAYYCYKAAGFKDVEMEDAELCELCGEKWNVLELEIEKKDYEKLWNIEKQP